MGCSGSKDATEPPAANAGGQKEASAKKLSDGEVLSDSKVEITLDADKSTRVKSLFTTFDMDDSGKLELAAFTGAVVQVGPHQTKVLDRLTDMDIDHDGFVTKEVGCPPVPLNPYCSAAAPTCTPPATLHPPALLRSLQEWLTWFTATAGKLNTEEFNLIMEEMHATAEEMVTLIRCTRLAAESVAEIEAPAAAPPLTGERLAKVQALFSAWDVEARFVPRHPPVWRQPALPVAFPRNNGAWRSLPPRPDRKNVV